MSPTSEAPVEAAAAADERVEIGPLRPEECGEVARLHEGFFGEGLGHGHSLAMLGADFLETVFYRFNLGNPYLFVDVARYRGEIVAFSVYSSDHTRVFRHTLRHHFFGVAWAVLRSLLHHPVRTTRKLLGNLAFVSDSHPPETKRIPAWFILLGVKDHCRTREFRERTGVWIAGAFKELLERNLRKRGCDCYWAAPSTDNPAAIAFYEKIQAELFATGTAQGSPVNYYRISTSGAAAS